ncbi:MAG TPA: EAL domain-containing protein [Gammaproteobacteria bacterium]|nr:EAL domain-containing protein [Gammaproteobacteria bacterium]
MKIDKLAEYLNLKHRQMLIVLGISSVVLSVATAAFFINDYLALKNQIGKSLATNAALLGAASAPLLASGDGESIRHMLTMASADEHIVQAVLYDSDSRVFARYVKPGYETQQVPAEELATAERGIFFESERAFALQPVEYDNRVRGLLYIEYDLESLRSTMSRYAAIAAAVFMFGIIVAWVMSNMSQRLLVEPIGRLAALVERISRTKNYGERMHINRRDEIGVLIGGFNNMLATIENQNTELRRHGEKLESLVELRTKQLHHRANYDTLTKLPNRHLLMEKLSEVMEDSRRNGLKTALLLIDIDRFKIINDSLGHHVGDELLQQVGLRLSATLRNIDCLARLGGDEFVILLGNISGPEDAELLARKIMVEFSHPFELKNHHLHVTASVGISLHPDNAEDAAGLLKRADISMYRSKSNGMNSYLFYDPSIDRSEQRLMLESRLRNAIANNELYMVYQPQIRLSDNKVCGFEALMRWNNPDIGEIYPAEFVPIAVEMGIINQLSKWALTTVCRQYAEWLAGDVHPQKVAVNISATDLLMVDFIQHVEKCILEYKIGAGCLQLEITEDVFLDRAEQIIETLQKLKDLGVAIAIDDFGTGYSSLSYLQDFPIDLLKLDGSFIRKISSSEKSRGIVASAISLAHGLGLQIVAECVDTDLQRKFLVAQGCDIVQGFYFSEPVPADELPQYLQMVNLDTYKSAS